MPTIQNNIKTPIDESVLDEPVPPSSEPANTPSDRPEDKDPNPDPEVKEVVEDGKPVDDIVEDEPEKEEEPSKSKVEETPIETPDQKEQKYKAQQTEAQIQAARTRELTSKVDEAANLKDPTLDELKQYVETKGADWDDLTPFEQAMAKETLISNRRFALVNESVQTTKKIDEWSGKVDTFLDENDGKTEYAQMSGNEAEFKKFAMKESHRGTPLDILASAFLHNLPTPKKVRGALFERGGGGGEREGNPAVITDADQAASLRENDPKEYRRKQKAGLIKIEV